MKRVFKQHGGILIDRPAKEAFDFFILNSAFSLLTLNGAFGCVLVATLDATIPDVQSPYRSFNSQRYNMPVRKILIKLAALTFTDQIVDMPWTFKSTDDKRTGSAKQFENEINIQTDIYFKTMNYLEPLCPANIYGEINNKADSISKLDIIIARVRDARHPYLRRYIENLRYDIHAVGDVVVNGIAHVLDIVLGVIGMEIGENFKNTIYDTIGDRVRIMTTEEIIMCANIARYELLQMAILTGYAHNDYHIDNLLYDRNYTNYFDTITGKVMIIDFGFSSKIPTNKLSRIKGLIKTNNYYDALSLLYINTHRSDGLMLDSEPDFYGWIINDSYLKLGLGSQSPVEIDEALEDLNIAHEAKIDLLVREFGSKVPPINLPLSSAVKNKFYNGLIEDIEPRDTRFDVVQPPRNFGTAFDATMLLNETADNTGGRKLKRIKKIKKSKRIRKSKKAIKIKNTRKMKKWKK